MQILINILITATIAIASTIGAYNYLPLSFIEKLSPKTEQKFGATITTIAGTDTIKDSRAVINTNFANLNSEILGVLTPARLTATSTSASSTIQWGLEVYNRPVSIGSSATTTLRGNATSSFASGVSATVFDARSTTATSTFGNGISISGGCLVISSGSCLSALDLTAQNVWTGASTTFVNGVSIGKSTTTQATTTSLYVSSIASSSQIIVNFLGVGVSTTTASTTEIGGNLQLRGICTSGCSQKHEITVFTWNSGTGADGGTNYTHTGDTSVTAVNGSNFQYNPANWDSDILFRMEATGGITDGTDNLTIGLATTTVNIVGTTMTGFTSTGGNTFKTTSTFTTAVMPASTQTMNCTVTLGDSTKTAIIRSCRLVAIISR